jgi:hypothetical protein
MNEMRPEPSVGGWLMVERQDDSLKTGKYGLVTNDASGNHFRRRLLPADCAARAAHELRAIPEAVIWLLDPERRSPPEGVLKVKQDAVDFATASRDHPRRDSQHAPHRSRHVALM